MGRPIKCTMSNTRTQELYIAYMDKLTLRIKVIEIYGWFGYLSLIYVVEFKIRCMRKAWPINLECYVSSTLR